MKQAAHARAKGKPVVLIARQRAEGLPFDWRGAQLLTYTATPTGLRALADEVVHRVETFFLAGGGDAE